MIQTKVVSDYERHLEDSINEALKELRKHEIVDIKLVSANDRETESEYFTALILYRT